ncbi:MAG TPA: hypothetical protein VGO67_14570 [Verrucomicrobiae bacterium]|jgi:hypothetical protein
MRAIFLSVVVAIVLLLSQPSASAQDGALPPDTSFNSTAGRGDIIWIKLTSDTSEEYNFGLDTGATVTVLDKSWEGKLEHRPSKRIVGSRWPISGVFAAPPLYLGSVRLLTADKVVTEDLAAHFPGRSVAGILGMDCLGHYCLQLDFVENKLRFLESSRIGEQELGKAFPLTELRGCFFVNDNVAGISGVQSLIDTGCNFDGVLAPPLFRQWTNQPAANAGTVDVGAHYPDGILGGVAYTKLYLAGDGEQNLIGLHFLARNLVTLNFPGRMLYLLQRSAGPSPGEENYFGRFYKNTFQTH